MLVAYLLYTLFAGTSGGLGQLEPLDGTQVGRGDTPSTISSDCRTGEDANQRDDCRIVGVVNSVQKFWNGVFERSGKQYRFVDTVFFTNQVQTGCGFASSEVGPFYCPQDQLVYIDLGFFDDLESRLGASNTPFVQAYVLAHEYGHHVQDQLGVLDGIRGSQQDRRASPSARSFRRTATRASGLPAVHTGPIEKITQSDINEGLDAAAAIGDDRIQQQTQGQVNPETWTHGSSEQRRRWFSRGYEQGKPAACDTFSGSI